MKKTMLITLLALVSILTLFACRHEESTELEISAEETFEPVSENSFSEVDGYPLFDYSMSPLSIVPHRLYSSLELLFADMAIAKFDEANRFLYNTVADALRRLRELYMPLRVPGGFELVRITLNIPPWAFFPSETEEVLVDDTPIIFGYRSIYVEYHDFHVSYQDFHVNFTWHRDRVTDENSFSSRDDGSAAYRRQHGYWFTIRDEFRLSNEYRFRDEDEFRIRDRNRRRFEPAARLTEQEFYYFSYAEPVIAWQLQGNAISMSIQGMENVRIFNEYGDEIDIEAAYLPQFRPMIVSRVSRHYTLYNIDGENRRVVGYRWRVNEESDRWQYVLEPDVYTFLFEGATSDELGLLVRHFDDHEVVSEVDYSAKLIGQDIPGFTLKVTQTDSFLTIDY